MTKEVTSDFIHLNFTGYKLNPNEITNCLGIKPIASSFATDNIETSSIVTQHKGMGNWVFGFDYSAGISDQLTQFTNYFRAKEEILKEIVSWGSVEEAYLDIVINPDYDFGIHRVLLNGKDVGFWGAIGIDIICNFWNPQMFGPIEEI